MADTTTPEQLLIERVLSPDGPPSWGDVTPILAAARSVYFVLHRAPVADPVRAVTEDFPRLADALTLDSEPVRREYVGRVRGKIDWGSTIRARCADEQNPQRFVCREAERHTDTLENQLLVWLLARMRDALDEIPEPLHHGFARHSVTGERFSSIAPHIDVLASGITKLAAHPRLRGVSVPTQITNEHIDAAHRARHPSYEIAAELCERWHTLHDLDEAGFRAVGRYCLLLPEPGPGAAPWLDLAALLLDRSVTLNER